MGVSAYLLKPIRQSELREAIARILGAREQKGAIPLVTRYSLQDARDPAEVLRVLIVEDEEAVRRPMVRYLTRRGAEVDEAADGVEGLARLRAQPANVILADLRMPRMGGVELYAQLEEERPELAQRVLFLSGDVSQLAEPGNTPVPRERVLVKPVELAELERRILAFVRGAGGSEDA